MIDLLIGRYTFAERRDGVVQVDIEVPCPRQPGGTATAHAAVLIHEPNSKNPGLQVPRPLGVHALLQVIKAMPKAGMNVPGAMESEQ